jgi:two-component system chemotaxis response regulator CheB
VLPSILGRAGALPAHHAEDGETIRAGVVVVAPPDHHLVVEGTTLRLDVGPRENGHRPSADMLLRSLARSWARRAAGAVLSGTMDDGAAGLRAIRATGGLAMAQDPAEAAFPGMPGAAIEEADPQVVAPVDELVQSLAEWAAALPGVPEVDEAMVDDDRSQDDVTPFTCPDCGGTLFLDATFGAQQLRCRVGHAFSAQSLMAGKRDALEATLWAGVVALHERAELSARIEQRFRRHGMLERAAKYHAAERVSRERAETLREMIPELLSDPMHHDLAEDPHGDAPARR